MNTWLYATRLTVAAMSVGRARRAFELTLPWCAEREQFGQAIGKFQGVSFQLADMITEIDAAEWLTLAGLHGGMGLMDDLPFERFWRDARVERIWDGTSEIQRHIIGRELLRPLGA